MQERVKTSFIPKASLKVERSESVRRSTFGVVNAIAAIILIAAIIAAGGVFFFEQFTKSSIENKRESLDRARAAFQPATIRELSRLDSRLLVGSTLLSSHTAPSVLFDFIERETLTSIRFRDFSYGEAGPGRVLLTMSGEARSFNAVALQSDAFGESNLFSEVIFENLNIDSTGNVVFDFSAVVNTSEIAYDSTRVRGVPSLDATGGTPSETPADTTPADEIPAIFDELEVNP